MATSPDLAKGQDLNSATDFQGKRWTHLDRWCLFLGCQNFPIFCAVPAPADPSRRAVPKRRLRKKSSRAALASAHGEVGTTSKVILRDPTISRSNMRFNGLTMVTRQYIYIYNIYIIYILYIYAIGVVLQLKPDSEFGLQTKGWRILIILISILAVQVIQLPGGAATKSRSSHWHYGPQVFKRFHSPESKWSKPLSQSVPQIEFKD